MQTAPTTIPNRLKIGTRVEVLCFDMSNAPFWERGQIARDPYRKGWLDAHLADPRSPHPNAVPMVLCDNDPAPTGGSRWPIQRVRVIDNRQGR